ncbi:ribosomal protein L11 methyltransferase [Candidatus Nitrotoga sp. HW29]|uniref:50S ribosomal protein L11 methyltransferase n=1 Tax=Candidatus Nitrotoga sp. HW29 TaxID=2886963 RepID=UPI001EF1E6A0|nr:50S ribosomal protein L11 methyltransferase [Candidatus Nitrotoga sp. HW29]CAH1903914.1 ribosomal protein L11 methyltransferase [Candidatus Nitrotoga sp. HW29]
MAWLTLTVTASASQAEMLSETLLALGALSVDIHDADADTSNEQAIFGEPGETVSHLWSHNRVTALFVEDTPIDAIMLEAAYAIGLQQPPNYVIATLADNDWVRLTQLQFNPIRISQRLWIVPTWHTPLDSSAINITLDPGLAFGTGSHPTTRLCLRWLDRHLQKGESVLDYGCGSGILTIAALKLGASSATGVDLDAQAVQASRDNARVNQVDAQFYLPNVVPKQQVDIVVANILTNPLKVLAPLLADSSRQGGQVVLSGVLGEQAEDVMKIYDHWFDFRPPVVEAGWACLSGVKR